MILGVLKSYRSEVSKRIVRKIFWSFHVGGSPQNVIDVCGSLFDFSERDCDCILDTFPELFISVFPFPLPFPSFLARFPPSHLPSSHPDALALLTLLALRKINTV